LSNAEIFWTKREGDSSDADNHTIGAKHVFFDIYGLFTLRTDKGKLSQCGHFADKEWKIFLRF